MRIRHHFLIGLAAACFVVACGDNSGNNKPDPTCGDGTVDTGEACDDGNTADGDGCDHNCTVTACGNGVQSANEGCDDGNTVDGDGCDSNCMVTGCGNGIMSAGEACDDGNTTSGDGCDNNCTVTGCNNGVMTDGEVCDDGNQVNGDGCDTNCTASACGNGVTGGTEECDDGNTTDFDGCSSICISETLEKEPNEDGTPSTGGGTLTGNDFATANADANGAYDKSTTIIAKLDPVGDEDVFAFTNSGTSPVTLSFETWNLEAGFGVGVSCGTSSLDNVLDIRDAAGTIYVTRDDRADNDYCAGGVKLALMPGQTYYAHVFDRSDNDPWGYYALQVTYTTPVCGDGILDAGEQCDDSNTTAGDGCSATCQLEGATTEMEPNEDGTPSTGGSFTTGNDFATANADANGAITSSTTITASILPVGDEDVFAIKNNGTTAANVILDTWNLAPGYGIGVPCGTSINTALRIRNASGTSLALNDDRNSTDDECSSLTFGLLAGQTVYAHVIAYGDKTPILTYALHIQFAPIVCGDGAVGLGEQCDDGNTTSGDGCSSTCQIEVICGDGTVGPGETCDDGNTANGDGCSSTCRIEGSVPEVEPNEDGTPSTGGSFTDGNDFGSANPDANGAFTASALITAAISPVGDEDVFKFSNPTTNPISARFDIYNLANGFGVGVACGTSIDTALQIRTATGTSLALNDDRNLSADRCSGLTYVIPAGQSVYVHVIEYNDDAAIGSYALKAVYTPIVCGDGMVAAGEQCDDGNTTNGDGCSSTCQIEIICGDGSVGAGEQCDDGNTTSGDGCSSTCQLEFVCGDGAVAGTEECDDGNTTNGDGCSSTCQVEGALDEVEPNGTTTTANAIPIMTDTLIRGSISPVGDLDYYQVTVTTGTVVRFETFTRPYDCLGGATIDLRLRNSMGTTIVSDTSGSGIAQCGEIAMYLDPGTYFIQPEERGNNATVAKYFLQVKFEADGGAETEPNDTLMTSNPNLASLNDVFVFGDHTMNADQDWYAITVPAGGKIRAEIVEGDRAAETCESFGVDSRLTLYDQNGVQLVDDDDDGRGFCSLIDGTGTAPLDTAAKNATTATQTYYLQVRQSGSASTAGGQFKYRLLVTIR